MHEGNLLGNLLLEMEVGGFLIPESEGGRYCVHGLNVVHDPSGDSCREVGDEGGGIFQFVILGVDNIQLKCVDVFLELLSRIDTSGRQPIHGFSSGVGVDEGVFKVGLELSEGSK